MGIDSYHSTTRKQKEFFAAYFEVQAVLDSADRAK